MPTPYETNFPVTQKIIANMTAPQRLKRIDDLIRQFTPKAEKIPVNLPAAVRTIETDPRYGDRGVGDPFDREKAKAYKDMTTEERYNLRDEFQSWGPLQIKQGAVDDVNQRYKTNYTHEDTFDRIKAGEIFRLYTSRYAKPGTTPNQMAQNWNRGKHRKEYSERVMNIFNSYNPIPVNRSTGE